MTGHWLHRSRLKGRLRKRRGLSVANEVCSLPSASIRPRLRGGITVIVRSTTPLMPDQFEPMRPVDFGRSTQSNLVRAVGLEPTRRCHRGILSPLRLPVPPRPLWSPDQRLSAFSGQVELATPQETRPSLAQDSPKRERFDDKTMR